MSKPFGVEMRIINGTQYAIWRNYLQNEMPYEDTNPILWFAKDLEIHDMLVCGVRTKREAIEFIQEQRELTCQ